MPDFRLEKEKEFHDKWAEKINLEQLKVSLYFEGSTSPENRFIITQLGDLKGKTILDIGCGAGENSTYFALQGAICTAADISIKMVNLAAKLAEQYEVVINVKVLNAMEIEFPDNSFDIVYASNILHHVDPIIALKEMQRVVKPGGKVCFWEPLKHNPIINVYRMMAKDVRTENEAPLDIAILKEINYLFTEVKYDTFWLASLWIFIKFYFIEKVNPNKERYWKKIIHEETRLRPLYHKLEKWDKLLKKIPGLKRLAWNIAVVATK